MNRKKFLKILLLGIPAIIVAPKILAEQTPQFKDWGKNFDSNIQYFNIDKEWNKLQKGDIICFAETRFEDLSKLDKFQVIDISHHTVTLKILKGSSIDISYTLKSKKGYVYIKGTDTISILGHYLDDFFPGKYIVRLSSTHFKTM